MRLNEATLVRLCVTDGGPVFIEVPPPTEEELQPVLYKIVARLMKLLTRRGVLIEEEGSSYPVDGDADWDDARTLRPLQAAACTCRLEFGPRAGSPSLDGSHVPEVHGEA